MNTRLGRRERRWSNLPKDLLTVIGERLGNRIDVLRFRAICTSWRSSIPPFPNNHKNNNNNSPRFPIKLPHPESSSTQICLTESTIYRLEPPSSDQDNKGWLVNIEEYKPGRFRLLNPLSHHEIKYNPKRFPFKILDLLEYRVFELGKAYRIENPDPDEDPVKTIYSAEESAVLLIYDFGKLAILRLGDEVWTQLDVEGWLSFRYYTDIMLYGGKFHAIDECGEVKMIDSSTLKLTKVWRPLGTTNRGRKKFLQSSCDLYIIDRNMARTTLDTSDHYSQYYRKSAYFKIYKLNEEDGWVEVKSLEGQVVAFLGQDCSFLASAEQFAAGCKGNCIYFRSNQFTYYYREAFTDDVLNNGSHSYNTCMFNLVDGSVSLQSTGSTNCQLFLPPPTLFKTKRI